MSICRGCHGSGIIRVPGDEQGEVTTSVCPYCSGSSYLSDSFLATWSNQRKEFKVKIIFDLHDELQAKIDHVLLPQVIADNSICECGTTLALGDFSVSRDINRLQFVGKFHCKNCLRKRKSIGKIFISALKSIKKLKFSSSGVEVERFDG